MTIRTFQAPLVGMRFRPPAEDVVSLLPVHAVLRLQLQPENAYDEDAVAVFLDGFNAKGTHAQLFESLARVYEQERPDQLEFFLCDPLMLGFVANSEKTGGKFASTIKSYLQLDGRTGVDALLVFDARGRPMLHVEWDSESAVPESQKAETTPKAPLSQVLDDEIPF